MLKITINKDISEYSEGMLNGLSMKETGRLFLGAVVAVILMFLFSRFMPFIAAVYLSLPVIAVVVLSGRKVANMSIREVLEYYPVYKAMRKGIEWSSTEPPDLSGKIKEEEEIAKKEKRK